jgi:hypothetical protein
MTTLLLRATVPRLEAAETEPTSLPCTSCAVLVFAPGWWCDDCLIIAYRDLVRDSDDEPNGDDEPDGD